MLGQTEFVRHQPYAGNSSQKNTHVSLAKKGHLEQARVGTSTLAQTAPRSPPRAIPPPHSWTSTLEYALPTISANSVRHVAISAGMSAIVARDDPIKGKIIDHDMNPTGSLYPIDVCEATIAITETQNPTERRQQRIRGSSLISLQLFHLCLINLDSTSILTSTRRSFINRFP